MRLKLFMLYTSVIGIAVLSIISMGIFIKLLVPSAMAATTDDTSTHGILSGSATQSLIRELTSNGFTAAAVDKVTRRQFTVGGTIVTLNGDNIQVFEYPSHEMAVIEASNLQEEYRISSQTSGWKNRMHLYVYDTLIIYYVGNSSTVINALDQNTGLPE